MFLQEFMSCLTQGQQSKILVVVTRVISDAVFAKMVQGTVWGRRKARTKGRSTGGRGTTTTYFKSSLPMESETPLRKEVRKLFRSFSCRLTGLAICDLAEHSHGINIKSLLKWGNFKWLKLICAFTPFKWIQSLFFNLVHLRPESYFLAFLNMVSKSRFM